ncbi:signal peptide-containing protein [Theileria equi strain WA]|uniref:Signal peptide-containing protein n=1 Tax=Theileria equi strain WA TaxID=1537102 RepID=L0AV66_THEEQ|nr:signal peptide-containing protein [Theileria equi strain WA]AFZ79502.1 signal peptide-containing protein [Theileria equi strain WA]|eukprot:XP_004829168.1 signal peptide-containing protein [Theileria equi strain WA]
MKVPFVLSLALLVRLSSCTEVVFDVSSPDPSLARDYNSTADGVTYYSYFPKGLFFSKVVDARVTIWEGKGEERCTIPFLSVEGDKSRLVLHVWPNSTESKMLYYEKVYGEWKLVTIRVKGLPESEEPVSPQEHAAELNFANLGCPLGGFSGSEAKPKVTLPPVKPHDDEDELGELDEYVPEARVAEPETPEVSIEDSQPEKESEAPVEPTIEQKLFTHEDIVVEGVPKVYEFSPSTETSREVSVTEDSHPEEPVLAAKESIHLETLPSDHTEASEDSSLEQLEGESPEVPAKPTPTKEASKDSPKTSADSFQLPSKATFPDPEEDVGPLVSKVDTSLFNVVDSFEDYVPVLDLKAKGNKAFKITFDDKTIWEDPNTPCSSAVLYFDEDRPTLLIVIVKDKNDKLNKVYRYHDGKQWKDGTKRGHNKTEQVEEIFLLLSLLNPQRSQILRIKLQKSDSISNHDSSLWNMVACFVGKK